jgi:hypothetical protein
MSKETKHMYVQTTLNLLIYQLEFIVDILNLVILSL